MKQLLVLNVAVLANEKSSIYLPRSRTLLPPSPPKIKAPFSSPHPSTPCIPLPPPCLRLQPHSLALHRPFSRRQRWNAMITGMAYNGKELQGVELFEEMVKDGVTPNSSSFVGVLTCCSHAALIDRARALFASMQKDYEIEPKLEHYGCMVDLLGRSGCIGEAFDLIREMRMKANTAMWGSLLSACRMHVEVELAVVVVKESISLEPSNSRNYVLSNLYAETGRWDAVEVVRKSMRENSIRKEPGLSAIRS